MTVTVADSYRGFAREEARGRSPLYEIADRRRRK